MVPIIKFTIDEAADQSALQGFVRDAGFDGGRNLEWAVYAKHPDLKPLLAKGLDDEAVGRVRRFIADFYARHGDEIRDNLDLYRRQWNEKQTDFFRLVEDIFGRRVWPPGKYEAYATLWGMFPRSLEDKTFQVPALYENRPYVNVIVAHEMLHFMFYDYLFDKHHQYRDEGYNFLTWNVSEIFNSVVQNSKEWLTVFGLKTMTYPEHESLEADLRARYPKVDVENLEVLTEEILRIAEKIRLPRC